MAASGSFYAFQFYDGGQSSEAEIHRLRINLFTVGVFIASTGESILRFPLFINYRCDLCLVVKSAG